MLRKIILWFQIRALEAMIAGRNETLHLVSDPLTRASMVTTQEFSYNELFRLKREYLK